MFNSRPKKAVATPLSSPAAAALCSVPVSALPNSQKLCLRTATLWTNSLAICRKHASTSARSPAAAAPGRPERKVTRSSLAARGCARKAARCRDVASESGHAPGRVLAPEDGARLLPVRGGHAAARAGRASRLPQPAWPRRRVPARGPETAHQLAGRGRPVRRAAPLRCARCTCLPRTCALARAMRRKHLPSDTRAHTDARQSAAGERKSSSGASMAGILKVRAPAAASALSSLSGLPACPC